MGRESSIRRNAKKSNRRAQDTPHEDGGNVDQLTSISAAVITGATTSTSPLSRPKCPSSLPLRAAVVPIAERPRALHSRCSARKARPFTSAYVIGAAAAAASRDDAGGVAVAAVASLAVADTRIEEPTHDRGDDDDDDDAARCWKPAVGVIVDPLVTAMVRTNAFTELDRRIVLLFYARGVYRARRLNSGSLSMEEDFGPGPRS